MPVHGVDLVIALPYALGADGVHVEHRLERFAEHPADAVGHARHVERWGVQRRLLREEPALLGDVGGHVGDALQVVVDLQDRDDVAQVRRHRLMQGQGVQAFLLDVHLQLVDLVVGRDDLLGQCAIALLDDGDGAEELLLNPGRQELNLLLELLDLTLQVDRHGVPRGKNQPNRPVT
jgi:hypothetical protein